MQNKPGNRRTQQIKFCIQVSCFSKICYTCMQIPKEVMKIQLKASPSSYVIDVPVKKPNVRYPKLVWSDSDSIQAIKICFIPT